MSIPRSALSTDPLPDASMRRVHGDGGAALRVGLIGCGGRGTALAGALLETDPAIKLTTLGDTFGDRLQSALRSLKSRFRDQVAVAPDARFTGLQAYRDVMDRPIDLVLLAVPPGFAPLYFEAAVRAGRHVFVEAPGAVDAAGVERLRQAGLAARQKGLSVAVGLSRRDEPRYRETVRRVLQGAIGRPMLARSYWNTGGMWVYERRKKQTELEYQLRNWYYFPWLGGDHVVQQQIHHLDVVNWIAGGVPTSAQGQGGRQVRTGPQFGQIFDHHAVEFTYDGGLMLFSQCRHIKGCWNAVSLHLTGTEGSADLTGGRLTDRAGRTIWRFGSGGGDGLKHQMRRLARSLYEGNPIDRLDELVQAATSALMGRQAVYTGRIVRRETFFQEAAGSTMAPAEQWTQWSDPPPVLPLADGTYPPIAVPGRRV